MFFSRRSKTSQIKNTWIEDVTISGKSKVLSLRPTYFVIKIDKQKIRELFSKDKYFIGYGLVVLLVLAVSSLSNPTKADVVNFYPTSCLGGWENPENATGAPSLEKDEKIESFNEENSARMRGTSDIFCGGFEGEIPPEAIANSFSLSFRISVDDGSVKHSKTEILVVPETEDVRVGTDNIEIIEIENSGDEIQSVDSIENQELDSGTDSTETVQSEEVPSVSPEVIEQVIEAETPAEESPEPVSSPEPEPSPAEPAGESAFLRFFTKIVHAEGEDTPSVDTTESQTVEVVVDEPVVIEEIPEPQSENLEQADTSSSEVINIDRSSSENGEVDLDSTPNEDSENIAEVIPNDAILKIVYTLDGEKWVSLGYVSMSSWKDLSFSLPLKEWSDVNSFQIKLEQVSSYDEKPVVFLDAIILSAEYDGLGEDPIRQPDFGTDIILSDKTIDDIRVIKILRNDIPMIWYTKIPPAVELPEGEVIEEQDGVEIIVVTEDETDGSIDNPVEVEVVAPVEEVVEPEVVETIEEPVVETLPVDSTPENTEIVPLENTEIISFSRKIKNLFGVLQVYAEGEDGGGESSGSSGSESGGGESSSSEGDSSGSESTSSSTSEPSSNEGDSADSGSSESSESDSADIPSFDSEVVDVGSSEGESTPPEDNSLILDSENSTDEQVNDSINKILNDINLGESGNIIINTIHKYDSGDIKITEDLILSTTEAIVPGLTPISYTEEQIMSERASGTEWNLVALGSSVDVATTVDVSGGIIFWFAPGNTAIYQYNTASGGISSEGISSVTDSEIKYLEPNGDVSKISVDIQDSEIITPEEERNASVLESVSDSQATIQEGAEIVSIKEKVD